MNYSGNHSIIELYKQSTYLCKSSGNCGNIYASQRDRAGITPRLISQRS